MKFCHRPFTFMYLGPRGEIWPCPWMHYVIGNIYEQDAHEIWRGEAAQAARESILNGSYAYCRKMSCPFLERGDLPEVSQENMERVGVAEEMPQTVSFCNDYTCNIACTNCRTELYCPTAKEREQINGVLEKMLPVAQKAQTVTMNGRGEFLANQSFIRFLERLKPEREDFSLVLESNGILFDEKNWERFSHLSGYHISVTVTVNSLRREVYRYLSGGFDRLDRVLSNLRFLSGLRREGKINYLSVATVVQESNFWEVPEMIRVFSGSERFAIDQIIMRPIYSWWGMARETYWFKNILNPRHPYHKEYLRILDDDCWKEPKVYDWGCHNLRESREHPLVQEKMMSNLLLGLYDGNDGVTAADRVRERLNLLGVRNLGLYGESEHFDRILRLLRDAGATVSFRLTRFDDAEGELPTISMPNLRPDAVDAILLTELYDRQNRTNNLRALGYRGQILTLEDLTTEGSYALLENGDRA